MITGLDIKLEDDQMPDPVLQEAVRQLQTKALKHDQELADGRVEFEGITKDIAQIGLVVGEIRDHTKDLAEIRTQTTKTNGRVKNLEDKEVESRISKAREDGASSQKYPAMKLVRDLIGILALAAAIIKTWG